jgi:ribosomal protein S18 acetylase RimI-like enzyme
MIHYQTSVTGITPEQLDGFFEGWPHPPSPQTHLRLLANSDEIVLAMDGESGQVVGFVTGITDRVLAAYIPLLEVRPAYRHQGIGTELVRRILARFSDLYMIDLLCDPPLQPFYASLGLRPATGAMLRNYARQAGVTLESRS